MASLELIRQLREAAEALDRPRVDALCTELIRDISRSGGGFPLDAARQVLRILRGRRYFTEVVRVAEALRQSGLQAPIVLRQYAQALIDLGQLTPAVSLLQELVAATEGDKGERTEAYGLLGRTYKQMYVNGCLSGGRGNEEHLRQAVLYYRTVFDPAPHEHLWHGVNVLALLRRAQRDGLRVEDSREPRELAESMLEALVTKGAEMNAWDLATGTETLLALGRDKEALRWAAGYAAHPGADAFALSSTLRQLIEVWGLEVGSEPGSFLLPLLRNAVLLRENGAVNLTPAEVRDSQQRLDDAFLEKVFGDEFFVSLQWYRHGLERAQAVARIGRQTDRGVGTGFLVRGRELHERYGDELFLLTNEHVVSPNPPDSQTLSLDECVVTFDALTEPGQAVEEYRLTEMLWSSSRHELDATLLRLDRQVTRVKPYLVSDNPPRNDGKQRVYIIGHPNGGALSFSIYDNHLLDYDERRLHYQTPTEPGSSGSPIFNAQWRLIGLHHSGTDKMKRLRGQEGEYAANEGIRISAIREALAKQLA